MNLSPEALTALLVGTPLGSAVVTWIINRNMANISSIPELKINIKTMGEKLDTINERFIELKADLRNLAEKKEKNWENIIKLKSNVEAQWRDVDELKTTTKKLELDMASGQTKK